MDTGVSQNWSHSGRTDIYSRRAEEIARSKVEKNGEAKSGAEEARKQRYRDRLDLSQEGLEAADKAQNAETVSETPETTPSTTSSNLFHDMCDARLAVLDRINTIISESGLELSDSAFKVELNRNDGTISIGRNIWNTVDESELQTLEDAIANDEELAALIEGTYSLLNRGDAEKMNADSFTVSFNSFDPKTLLEEKERNLGLVAFTSNAMNPDYVQGAPVTVDLLVQSPPSITGLDRRLPIGQSQALVSDIREQRGAALDRINAIIKEKELDMSEGGFTVMYDRESDNISVRESRVLRFDEENKTVVEKSLSAESRETLQSAIENDSQLREILKGTFETFVKEKMIDESVKSFGLEYGSFDTDRERFTWHTMLQNRMEPTSDGSYAPSVMLTYNNPLVARNEHEIRLEYDKQIEQLNPTGILENYSAHDLPGEFAPEVAETQSNFVTDTAALKNATAKSAAGRPANASLAKVAAMLGLGGSAGSQSSLASSLRETIKADSASLQKTLSAKLKRAGLDQETKKMTFSVNAKGKVTVSGLTNKIKQKEIEKIINADPELVEEMKSLKAKMEIADALESDPKFNLESKEYDAARRQLAKDLLKSRNVDISQLSASTDPETGETRWSVAGIEDASLQELASDAAIREELLHALEPDKSIASDKSRALISMKRGEITEGTDEKHDFQSDARAFKVLVAKKLENFYNENKIPWEQRISDFSLKINSKGSLSVESVQLPEGSDRKSEAAAKRLISSLFDDEIRAEAKALGLGILEQHDDEHGDVQEYAHHLILGGSKAAFTVHSPEADRAAMEEMVQLGKEISADLGSYFRSSLSLNRSFEIQIDKDGRISFDKSMFEDQLVAGQIERTLKAINERTTSDDPLSGEFTSTLSSGLQGVVEKVVQLNEVRQKFHEQPLQDATLSLTISHK